MCPTTLFANRAVPGPRQSPRIFSKPLHLAAQSQATFVAFTARVRLGDGENMLYRQD